jgi:hypothetical protein
MHDEHRKALEKRHNVSSWYGRSEGERVLKEFRVEAWQIRGWRVRRATSETSAEPPTVRALWERREGSGELLAVDMFVCASVRDAHAQLLELLANTESDAVETATAKAHVGDVSFVLANTMALFARANVVVWVRNAGRKVVGVGDAAREIDADLLRRLGAQSPAPADGGTTGRRRPRRRLRR